MTRNLTWTSFLLDVVLRGGVSGVCLTGLVAPACAGPLADSIAVLIRTNGGSISWESENGLSPPGNGEELRGVAIGTPDGQRIVVDRALLAGNPESPNIRMQDIVLSGSRGQGGARSVEVTGDTLAALMRQPVRPDMEEPGTMLRGLADANGLLIVEGARLIAARHDGGRPEEVLVERLEANLLATGMDTFTLAGLYSTSGTGEVLSVRTIAASVDLANFTPSLDGTENSGLSGRIGEILRNGLNIDYSLSMSQVLVSDKDRSPVARLGQITFRRDSDDGAPTDDFRVAMARAATIERPEARGLAAYNAMVSLNSTSGIEFSGLWLPWADLMPGRFSEAVRAAGGRVLSGEGHIASTIKQGRLDVDMQVDFDGAADLGLKLTLGVPPVDAARIDELASGDAPRITDIPPITIEHFSAEFQDRGLDELLRQLGLGGSGEAITGALTAMVGRLDGVPLVAVQAKPLISGVVDWVESGRETKSCVVTAPAEGDTQAPTLIEVGMVSMLSPAAAAKRMRLAYIDCY